jgi:hypothetical protein
MDEWAALWTESLGVEDEVRAQAIARGVGRRARLLENADLGIGILIAAAVFAALVLKPAPVTLAVGLVAAGGLLWSCWNRHQLRQRIRRQVEVQDRIDLIQSQVTHVRTELQRSIIALIALPPVVLLFAMLTHSLQNGGSLAGFGDMLLRALTAVPVGPAIIAAIVTLIVQQARSVRALRSELRRLQMLEGQYRQEAALDRLSLG